MPGLTDNAEGLLIDHQFRTASWNPPGTGYIALLSADPGDPGNVTEISGGGYARVAVAAADANWTAPAVDGAVDGLGRQRYKVSNVAAITFPAPNAAWNGGNPITHWAYMDGASGGNAIFYAPLTNPKTISAGGAAPEFAAGDLIFSLASRSDYATQKILNHILRTTKMAKPAAIHFALMALVGGNWVEVAGGSYQRVVVATGDANFSAPVGGNGQASNINLVQFAQPTADWGNLVGFRALDPAGNVLHELPLPAPIYVNNGDRAPRVPAGGWVYSLD
ncbi:hypothetical protein AZSI13_32210 [Azospira sp. I13]|uniref:phage tail fiber protein n=1 Tax=Azospira sp. I13 TaxID=1765050 RepID=UPI000D436DEF|nr:hypothetical protein [Azospira sp. I13]GBG03894.1 hypothetical protein AZSI13_32210 [Azospira sp. I13]